ncbi:hypothetical protein, partial [Xanthomonas sacchari]|uniref:hypothetical protein n=1 Tax=Xanthomonas sacchari TaxID=56458 RepID=UPI00225C2BC6
LHALAEMHLPSRPLARFSIAANKPGFQEAAAVVVFPVRPVAAEAAPMGACACFSKHAATQ